jgi:hypothetical protein
MELRDAGYHCAVFLGDGHQPGTIVPDSVDEFFWQPPAGYSLFPRPLQSVFKFLSFRKQLAGHIDRFSPDVVVAFMFHALACLPPQWGRPVKLVGAVWDVFELSHAGHMDRRIIPRGWQSLKLTDVVWASDIFKARLAQGQAQLTALPVVCHNCPRLDYLPEPTWPRDGWLRDELRQRGATLGETSGSILLRAGAVGECGGIEETLAVMRALPEDFVFCLMGRPSENYKKKLLRLIGDLGLERRAFLFDRPSDEVWKRALQGADIGHLIHGPFPPGRMTRMYELNSSLSNNRLFQYMAAGLAIIAYDDPRMNVIYAEVPCFRVARLSRLEQDILAIWKELGTDVGLQKRLGGAGRIAHSRTFNWKCQFAPILERIL